MNNVNILPIFNQSSPRVWDSFVNIRAAAMKHVYNVCMSKEECETMQQAYFLAWRTRKFNFAFGAYNNSDIVGFVSGDCVDRVATIRSLYVLPEFMSNNIGGRLLNAAENAGSFGARTLDLVSLYGSRGFYERYGYRPIVRGSNHYIKSIHGNINCKTVPVFYSTPSITRACRQISEFNKTEYNPKIVNKEHSPMFAYLDVESTPQGFVVSDYNIGTPARTYIGCHQPVDYIAKRLNRAHMEWMRVQQYIEEKSHATR